MILPESKKFNGKNFHSFKMLTEMIIAGKGLRGYLDGMVPQPPDSYTAINTMIADPNNPLDTEPTTPWNSMKRNGSREMHMSRAVSC